MAAGLICRVMKIFGAGAKYLSYWQDLVFHESTVPV